MLSPPGPPLPLLKKEDFAVFGEGLDPREGLAFDRAGQIRAGGEAGQIAAGCSGAWPDNGWPA